MPPSLRNRILISVFIVNLLALNALAVIGLLKIKSVSLGSSIPNATTYPESNLQERGCTVTCREYIDERLGGLPSPIVQVTTAPTTKPASTLKPKSKSTSYFTISGSASTLNNTWTDVAGSDFYFDPAEHPGLVDVRFEVNLKLVNGNGMAYARLYDVTHSIGVNSEVSTNSQASVLVTSGNINFWSGRNQYRVQIKSLTADTAVYESGRLKMVIEN